MHQRTPLVPQRRRRPAFWQYAREQPLRPQRRGRPAFWECKREQEEREACLLAMRQRIASQTPEERESCCQQMRSVNSKTELRSETPDDTEARRQQDAESHRRCRPLFHQPPVQSKMRNFHLSSTGYMPGEVS